MLLSLTAKVMKYLVDLLANVHIGHMFAGNAFILMSPKQEEAIASY